MARPSAPTKTSVEAAIRGHFGLSQADLARYLGVSVPLLSHYETGRRPAPLAVVRRPTSPTPQKCGSHPSAPRR